MTPNDILKRYFGYDTFRGGQETLIDSILSGRDVLGVMPTGAGKSICYQVPAMLLPGITLVVSPLISLMKDQVGALGQAGIPAAFINSTLSYAQTEKALSLARQGQYKLIYVAPERLLTPGFLAFAQSVDISLVAVDEAHCISQWGQDFRPSYSQIPSFLAQLNRRCVVAAFTATATEPVQNDILKLLDLQHPERLVTGFDRKNLYFEVQSTTRKLDALLLFLQKVPNQSGIVYCATRKNVEAVCEELCDRGLDATRYHAGLSEKERRNNQDDFLFDRKPIMVATNAFGMGIDKSNVSFVVHYNMPKDLESYYQEAGRAGRDGAPAHCLLLYSKGDVRNAQWLIDNGSDLAHYDPETAAVLRARQLERLKQMTFYSTSSYCYRSFILRYFGERPPVECGYCSNCLGEVDFVDVTVEGQKFLSCLKRMGTGYTWEDVRGVLTGKLPPHLEGKGLEELSTFGISSESDAFLQRLAKMLHKREYIAESPLGHLTLNPSAREILFGGQRLALRQERAKVAVAAAPKKPKMPKATSAVKSLAPEVVGLYQALQGVRKTYANVQGVPAFVICADTTLLAMCTQLPKNDQDLLDVPGLGEAKVKHYGEGFLQVIHDYLAAPATFQPKEKPPKPEHFVAPTPQALAEIALPRDNCSVSVITGIINEALSNHGCTQLKRGALVDFLVDVGYLRYEEIDATHKRSVVTPQGAENGITVENRTGRDGVDFVMNHYTPQLQQWIVGNLETVLKRQEEIQ